MRTNLILLLLVASTTLSAQFTRHFNLIVGAGWSGNYNKTESNTSGRVEEIEGYRTSRMTGVGFNFDFIKRSSFEGNLLFQQTGSVYKQRYNGVEVSKNRLTALSLQWSLAYRYTWIKRQNFGLHSKFGFAFIKPLQLVYEDIRKGSRTMSYELSLKEAYLQNFYYPYYFGVSANYKDYELGLSYTHSPTSDFAFTGRSFVRANSIFSNLQFELRYRIY